MEQNKFSIDERAVFMKATGIVRRIDDLGRIVIPKEIRRTMRIREGDPTLTTLIHSEDAGLVRFCIAMVGFDNGNM